TWNSSTRCSVVGVLKAWGLWLEREGYAEVSPFRHLRRPPMQSRKPPPPGALEATIAALTGAAHDFAVVLYDTGCRPGELISLEAPRIDPERSTALVAGKGGRRLVG